jgi:pimeloyl-ACP methyl ester carboxylesterase
MGWQDLPVSRDDSPFTWQSVRVGEHWIRYRVGGPVDAPPMVHVHGFAISGSYLLPTAALLTDAFRVYVPDLPGFGRSPKPRQSLGIDDLGAVLSGFLDAVGVPRAVFVGNSLGCAITTELIYEAPAKVERAVMVGLAGGQQNQPLPRAIGQMAWDGLKEPPALLTVAAPDYLRFGPLRALRLFSGMTAYPALTRFLSIPVPVLAVIGSEDPLRPSWRRIRRLLNEVPPQVRVVLLQGAAHAINFSHPRELAYVIRQYVADEPIRMDPDYDEGLPVLELLRPGEAVPRGVQVSGA